MSKRKAGVNDIIYELDNDDVEISSEDEVKEAKINRLEPENDENNAVESANNEEQATQVGSTDTVEENDDKNTLLSNTHNGGKISPIPPDNNIVDNEPITNDHSPSTRETESEVDSTRKLDIDGSKTTIYNEDIIIDSPASNIDLGVVGCENRIPLVTVRFRDRQLASNYKNKVKKFMLRLIKLHEKETSLDLDSETDIELDIWPEDLNDDDDSDLENEVNEPVVNEPDNLFFIDTDPCSDNPDEIPTYKNVSTLISNHEDKEEPAPSPIFRRGPTCFNCDGAHQLRDCVLPKNSARIADKRKQMFATRVGRYHVEDEQKYGHLLPGRISGQLRHALNLKRHELPIHIYRMRMLGYPPGWLEEARISHSGITMFDSSGAAILDPEEEEGEVSEPGSKDKFDIKKILDFPGFNVPASSRYKEEAHMFGLPPMSEQDSKIAMLQMLAPNAMKAYKRKKLTLFPSASNNTSMHEVAEMELDSGDESVEFPSVPPLPDDAPPPPPPPPPKSPSPEPMAPGTSGSTSEAKSSPPGTKPSPLGAGSSSLSEDPIETENAQDKAKTESSSGRGSPSLDALEEKKKRLLSALEGDDGESDISLNISTVTVFDNENINTDNKSIDETEQSASPESQGAKDDLSIDTATATNDKDASSIDTLSPTEIATHPIEVSKVASTPESKTGHVKTSLYGTPVMNIASSYVKLPSDDKFAKDICDVINFENLPNSTGKYKQICDVLKRVKSEVDRIQDS